MIKHKFADINGIKMHYATAGDGPLMLFLHGFPEFWGVWQSQLHTFSQEYTVVAPDMRGYNLSDKPEQVSDYHIEKLVADIKGLVDHLGYDKMILVAQDWGALVAWSFTIRHPLYVDKLAIVNMTHPALLNRDLQENANQQQASQYMLLFREQGEELIMSDDFAWAKAIALDANLGAGYIDKVAYDAILEAWSQPGAITGGLNYYRASKIGPPNGDESGGSNILDGIPEVQQVVNAPTLIVFGELDPFLLPEGLEGIEAYVPNVTIKRVPDATHWLTMEKTELFNSYLQEFIDS